MRLKTLGKNRYVQSMAAWIFSLYIRLVFITSKIEYRVHPEAEVYTRGEANAIFAFWHGRMMALPAFCPPKRIMHVLISEHSDGRLISQVIAHFKQRTINGSAFNKRLILSCKAAPH